MSANGNSETINALPRVVWRQRGRGLSNLNRGHRTPDPSPSRDAVGLPSYQVDLEEDDYLPSRTPSPPPSRMLQVHQGDNEEDRDQKKSAAAHTDRDEVVTPRGHWPGEFGIDTLHDRVFQVHQGDNTADRDQKKSAAANTDRDEVATPRGHWPGEFGIDTLHNHTVSAAWTSAPLGRSTLNPDNELLRSPMPQQSMNSQVGVGKVMPMPLGPQVSTLVPAPPQNLWPRQRSRQKSEAVPFVQPNQQSVVSMGSIGHPQQCSDPCKYNLKPKGCKDGANCDRCHLCPWTPSSGKAKPKGRPMRGCGKTESKNP